MNRGRPSTFPYDVFRKVLLQHQESLVDENGKLVPRNSAVWEHIHTDMVKEGFVGQKQSLYVKVATGVKQYGLKQSGLLKFLQVNTTPEDSPVGDNGSSDESSAGNSVQDSEGFSFDSDDDFEKNIKGENVKEEVAKNTKVDKVKEDVGEDFRAKVLKSRNNQGENVSTDRVKFDITFSKEEWANRMAPDDVVYVSLSGNKKFKQSRKVLKRNSWTTVVHSHFRQHTRLPCKIRYSGGKIQKESDTPYCRVRGRCVFCEATFKGKIEHPPEPDSRVIMKCVYSGAFRRSHPKLKMQIRGELRTEYKRKMIQEHKSGTYLVKSEASVEMMNGESEATTVPDGRVLRQLKYEGVQEQRLHEDPIEALLLGKYSSAYEEYIKDLTIDRLLVPFWNSAQVHAERQYCLNTTVPRISIDASGKIVRRLARPNGRLSGHIFLYEVVILDKETNSLFPVCSMFSEVHDTETIRHWLAKWILDGAAIPKEVVTDMSLALMNACVQAFTDFKSLQSYLNECAKILSQETSALALPPCYIRNDVAHTMKLFASFDALKNQPRRTRQFYLRSLTLLITCGDIYDAREILRHIFTVALSESEGEHPATGGDMPAEISKRYLQKRIGGEVDEPQLTAKDIFFIQETNRQLQEIPRNYGANFLEMAEDIACDVKNCLEDIEGSRGNQQHLPSIIKEMTQACYLLPVFSNVMARHYGFGDPTASSSGSEGNFNEVKSRLCQHVKLPGRIDEILFLYLQCLDGTVKLANAKMTDAYQRGFEREPSLTGQESPPSKAGNVLQSVVSSEVNIQNTSIQDHDRKYDSTLQGDNPTGSPPSTDQNAQELGDGLPTASEDDDRRYLTVDAADREADNKATKPLDNGLADPLGIVADPIVKIQPDECLPSVPNAKEPKEQLPKCPQCAAGDFDNVEEFCIVCTVGVHKKDECRRESLGPNGGKILTCRSCVKLSEDSRCQRIATRIQEKWRNLRGERPPETPFSTTLQTYQNAVEVKDLKSGSHDQDRCLSTGDADLFLSQSVEALMTSPYGIPTGLLDAMEMEMNPMKQSDCPRLESNSVPRVPAKDEKLSGCEDRCPSISHALSLDAAGVLSNKPSHAPHMVPLVAVEVGGEQNEFLCQEDGSVSLVPTEEGKMSGCDDRCSSTSDAGLLDAVGAMSKPPFENPADLRGPMKATMEPSEYLRREDESVPIVPTEKEKLSGCPQCVAGEFDGVEKFCFVCAMGVHERDECCQALVGPHGGNVLICQTCVRLSVDSRSQRIAAREKENWRGLSMNNNRQRSSYLEKNSEWLHMDLSSKVNTVPLGLLKNGHRPELKPIKINSTHYVLSNTCAFDAVFQVIASSYCDSEKYKEFLDGEGSPWFISEMVTLFISKGACAPLYRLRALALKDLFPHRQILQVTQVNAKCNVANLIERISQMCPIATETRTCSSPECPEPVRLTQVSLVCISTPATGLVDIQGSVERFLNGQRITVCRSQLSGADLSSPNVLFDETISKYPMCNGERQFTRSMNKSHLFLEVLQSAPLQSSYEVKLQDLPKEVTLQAVRYSLRGVVGYEEPPRKEKSALGHYKAYCRRLNDLWEVYDDLKNKKENCSGKTVIKTHCLHCVNFRVYFVRIALWKGCLSRHVVFFVFFF